MKIVVDAMGGDRAPAAIVAGVLAAASICPELELILVGNRGILAAPPANVALVETTETIASDDMPLMAIRRKRNSSLVVALQMLKDGAADAVISAGNTGALMAGASLIVGRIPGVSKPALAPVLPTRDGKGTVAVDVGATMDPKPENLYQYALMGRLFAQTMLGVAAPRIGLLNVGSEPQKGNELAKQTYLLLEQSELNFVGNIEAREVMDGRADVLITDGFVGNVLLKAMEGVAQSLFAELKHAALKGGIKGKLGALLLKDSLLALKARLDYTQYGGSPLLGIDGLCLKCHGTADAETVKNAIVKQAYPLIKAQTIASIRATMEG